MLNRLILEYAFTAWNSHISNDKLLLKRAQYHDAKWVCDSCCILPPGNGQNLRPLVLMNLHDKALHLNMTISIIKLPLKNNQTGTFEGGFQEFQETPC